MGVPGRPGGSHALPSKEAPLSQVEWLSEQTTCPAPSGRRGPDGVRRSPERCASRRSRRQCILRAGRMHRTPPRCPQASLRRTMAERHADQASAHAVHHLCTPKGVRVSVDVVHPVGCAEEMEESQRQLAPARRPRFSLMHVGSDVRQFTARSVSPREHAADLFTTAASARSTARRCSTRFWANAAAIALAISTPTSGRSESRQGTATGANSQRSYHSAPRAHYASGNASRVTPRILTKGSHADRVSRAATAIPVCVMTSIGSLPLRHKLAKASTWPWRARRAKQPANNVALELKHVRWRADHRRHVAQEGQSIRGILRQRACERCALDL